MNKETKTVRADLTKRLLGVIALADYDNVEAIEELAALIEQHDLCIVTKLDKAVLEATNKFPTEAIRVNLDAQPLATRALRKQTAEAGYEWALAVLQQRGELK